MRLQQEHNDILVDELRTHLESFTWNRAEKKEKFAYRHPIFLQQTST